MFGDKLRKLRTVNNLSQQDIAKLTGKSQQAVNLWEKGENEPAIETIKKLADHFSVTTDFLLGQDMNPGDIAFAVNENAQIYCAEDVDKKINGIRKYLAEAVQKGRISENKAVEVVDLIQKQLMLFLDQEK